MRSVNSMYFDARKDAVDFISKLWEAEEISESNYHIDIHCYRETESLWVVEWIQTGDDWGKDVVAKFVPVEPEDSVMRIVNFPDGHYDYVEANDKAVKQAMDDWYKENPSYQEN